MLTKVLVGLIILVAIVHGLAPDVVPENILPLVLVIIGLVYGAMCIEADRRMDFMVFTIAVAGAAGMDVLNHIHMVGQYLDAIVDQIVVALFAAVMSILALRTWERLMAAEEE